MKTIRWSIIVDGNCLHYTVLAVTAAEAVDQIRAKYPKGTIVVQSMGWFYG